MRLYFAGIFTSRFDDNSNQCRQFTEVEMLHKKRIDYYLESYHYIHRQSYVDKIKRDKKVIFLDSGAFSAFTKGVTIDLPAYCEYIKRNREIIDTVDGRTCASVLDGIGDPLKTWQNQMAMEAQGATPLPCFHYGEDEEYLKWYIENYPYITLGGMVMVSTGQLKLWLDRIWSRYLLDSAGKPKIKVHGFGMTILELMERYPWFSVDSSSWVHYAANGHIFVPDLGMITVSEHSPAAKIKGRHIDNFTPPQREAIAKRVEALGFSVDRMRKMFITRAAFNFYAYKELQDQVTAKNPQFKLEQETFF